MTDEILYFHSWLYQWILHSNQTKCKCNCESKQFVSMIMSSEFWTWAIILESTVWRNGARTAPSMIISPECWTLQSIFATQEPPTSTWFPHCQILIRQDFLCSETNIKHQENEARRELANIVMDLRKLKHFKYLSVAPNFPIGRFLIRVSFKQATSSSSQCAYAKCGERR